MTRFQDYQDREARNANFEQWRERMERFAPGEAMTQSWHHIGRRNALGQYTIFIGYGEGYHNQLCMVESLDDADLICAVHDLLQGCKLLRKALLSGPQQITQAEIDSIQAAIAKAEGKELNTEVNDEIHGDSDVGGLRGVPVEPHS